MKVMKPLDNEENVCLLSLILCSQDHDIGLSFEMLSERHLEHCHLIPPMGGECESESDAVDIISDLLLSLKFLLSQS